MSPKIPHPTAIYLFIAPSLDSYSFVLYGLRYLRINWQMRVLVIILIVRRLNVGRSGFWTAWVWISVKIIRWFAIGGDLEICMCCRLVIFR